ncbi:MAG: sigma 54-interacting transcriptional regulator, partial [Halioglobus sp.]|nr:sigma 54-interacting transcriptional regulator [Halioglobus sp.]
MSDSAVSLLMVEDSPSLAEVYRAYLEGTGHEIHIAANLKEAFAAYNAHRPDVVLLDIQLPDGSGMDFLKRYGDAKNDAAIIVMTAHGTNEIALEAMDMGASDFLTKPFDASRLQVTLENAVAKLRLGKKVSVLSALERDGFSGFIGRSTAMQAVYKRIESLAASDATAFIAGESGTGKELAAEAIHNSSRRHSKELVAINCGAIPTELMESELFGHVKGSFTGAGSDRTGAVGAAEGG